MQKKSGLNFPKKFLWGASTSSHQVEGNTHNQWSVWELEYARTLAAQSEYSFGDLERWDELKKTAKQPNNYVSGQAADHYNRYEEDFMLLESMNMNAFRFSIEWSRVEPEEGAWNVEAIEHYKQYIKVLKKRDIEPIVTLFHFTLPIWFCNKGGFEKRRNVSYFVRYAQKIMSEVGDDVKFIITINEPMVYAHQSYWQQDWPPAVRSRFKLWRVINNLAYAHRRVAKQLHGMSRRYQVSIAKHSVYFYAGDNAWLSRLSASVIQYLQDDYMLKKVRRHCDFLGVNFYQSQRVYGYRTHNPDQKTNDMGWDMHPAHIQFALERLYVKYRLPVIVTENGLADERDEHRQWWLTQTLLAMQKAMEQGVDLKGYMHWSLLDNFEWDKGNWPRFGLAEVNYKTQKRILRPSARWYGKVIKKLRS